MDIAERKKYFPKNEPSQKLFQHLGTAKPKIKTKKCLHIISNTHWDREHRHGLQETRCMLVEMMDRLLVIMEQNPKFKHFTMDGQCIPLEDYLKINPEKKDEISERVQAGRLHIGPWYTLPDMNAVNGEALIRNLLTGERICRKFGPTMKFGYSIFSFGQIAQLPQIYQGFGIEDVVVYKRFSPKVFKQSEYLWTAPDGSQVLASRLGSLFRVNGMMCFTIPVILGGDPLKPGWEAEFTDSTRLAHMTDSHFRHQYARELEPDIRVRKEKVKKAIEDLLDSTTESAGKKNFMAFDGIDFSYPLKEIPEAIAYANEIMNNDLEIVHSSPMAYFAELRKELQLDKLYNHCGEIRFGPIDAVHSECMSANIELKIRNNLAENTILYYAEPFSTFEMISGGRYPFGLFNHAWSFLFKAHAHDSIHGTGVPKIKRDTLARLDQAQELGDTLSRQAFENIVTRLDTSQCSSEEMLVTVFNPSPRLRSEVLAMEIDLPNNENVTECHLETLDGKRIESYEHSHFSINMPSVNGENRPKSVVCDRRLIEAYIEDIPAFGYKTLKIKRQKNAYKEISPFAQPVFPFKPIGQQPNMLDNGILQVTVEPNGSIMVRDKEHGHIYKDLNIFSDSGCAGDMWIHEPPANNRTVTSLGAPASIGLTRNSALSGTIKTDIILNIPEGLTQDRSSRSRHTEPTIISVEITLVHDSRRVDFSVTMDNAVRDHRLTVGFPTGILADSIYSENPFEIRKRPVDVTLNKNGEIDNEIILRQPMQNFTDISDRNRGMTLMTRGLKEFETRYRHDKTVDIELTLLRSVNQRFPIHNDVFVSFKDDESSQCLGKQAFEYALYFHQEDHIHGKVISESQQYQTPVAAIQFGRGSGNGTLPLDNVSFLSVTHPNTVVNCVKKAADTDDVIIRLTNLTSKVIDEEIEFYHPLAEIWLTDMNEEKIKKLKIVGNNRLKLTLSPYRIVTLCVAN